nr:hypothetical protein [Tanacetum cinerariifolium]
DDYMNVLNDEEMVRNYSLDDMKFQDEEMVPNYSLNDINLKDEEDNLNVKERHVEHQPVDELIDVPKDKTTLLQENVKTKKCDIRKNYVLRSVKERKKKLAMALDSLFGQQRTTTPAPPKTRTMSSIEDTIVAPDFEEEISGSQKCDHLMN